MLSSSLQSIVSTYSGIILRSDSGAIASLHRITLVDTRAGAIILTLPDSANVPGLSFVIKDKFGSAETNNITINPSNGQTIDGEVSFVISSNFESVTIISDGQGFFIA